jgi:hypothetical protein
MRFATIQGGIEGLKDGIANMSSSAIMGLSGIAPAAPSLAIAAVQTAAKPPTATPASNDVQQPILMVPTKPPLSAAVMAELIGQQTSSYGSLVGSYSADQKPAAGVPSANTNQSSPSLV